MRALLLLLVLTLSLPACGADPATDPAPADNAEPAGSPSAGAEASAGSAPPAEPQPIDPATTGTLRGVVLFEGDPPPLRVLDDVPDQPGCHEGHETPPISEFMVVQDGRVKNVFVTVEDGLEGWVLPPPPAEPVELVQHGCIYRPHAMGMRVGQELHVVNADPTNHNVNASPRKNPSFNQNQGPGAGDIEVRYEYAELIPFRCDIHPWMSAYVGVFEHPFFDVTGADGAFEIGGLPPGTYTVEAQHPDNKKIGKKGKLRATVEIRPGEVTELELSY